MVLWIDVERSGHPLKVEEYYINRLIYRVDPIDLDRFKAQDGQTVWFPTRGEMNVFGSLDNPSQEPTGRETFRVVTGSLQINLDLPDEVFKVHTRPRKELGNAIALHSRHLNEVKLPGPERLKSDPASVQARLDAKMAEADRQAKEVEASSPARTSWNGIGATQAIFAVLGLGLIGTAGFWVWRRS